MAIAPLPPAGARLDPYAPPTASKRTLVATGCASGPTNRFSGVSGACSGTLLPSPSELELLESGGSMSAAVDDAYAEMSMVIMSGVCNLYVNILQHVVVPGRRLLNNGKHASPLHEGQKLHIFIAPYR